MKLSSLLCYSLLTSPLLNNVSEQSSAAKKPCSLFMLYETQFVLVLVNIRQRDAFFFKCSPSLQNAFCQISFSYRNWTSVKFDEKRPSFWFKRRARIYVNQWLTIDLFTVPLAFTKSSSLNFPLRAAYDNPIGGYAISPIFGCAPVP